MKIDPTADRVLLIVRHADKLSAEDRAVQQQLERRGYPVIAEEDTHAKPGNYGLVVLSSVVGAPNLSAEFRTADVPIVVMGEAVYADLGMTERNVSDSTDVAVASNYGREPAQQELVILNSWHSMAGGLKRKVSVAKAAGTMTWARPKASAVKVASLVSTKAVDYRAMKDNPEADRERTVIFGYESGAEMFGLIAPARRVGLFFDHEMVLNLNNNGWELFDAAVKWAVGDELKQFAEVFQEEWQEINERRQRQRIELKPTDIKTAHAGMAASGGDNGHTGNKGAGNGGNSGGSNGGNNGGNDGGNDGGNNGGSRPTTAAASESDAQHAPLNLTGLALSGGGIRSATFCLGLLQGLQQNNVLRVFDYLSTVSGGGYLGGWWSAWLAREGLDTHVRSAYPLLGVKDIKCLRTLSARLLADDDIAAHLCKRLFATQGTEELVKRLCRQPVPCEDDAKALVNELNKLLPAPCIFDDADLVDDKISLTQEVRELHEAVKERPNDNDFLRLNRLLLENAYPDLIRANIFPPKEQIEPARTQHFSLVATQGSAHSSVKEGKNSESGTEMMCAGHDPTHHLRLFANYLTPRKGLLSSDTWRAIAVISRNLMLNWLTLLPLLVTFMLLGQLFFVLRTPMDPNVAVPKLSLRMDSLGVAAEDKYAAPLLWNSTEESMWKSEERAAYKHDFIFPYWSHIARYNDETAALKTHIALRNGEAEKNTAVISDLQEQLRKSNAKANALSTAHNESLKRRIIYAAKLCGLICALVLFMSAVWMIRNTSGSSLLGWFGAVAFWVLAGILLLAFQSSGNLEMLLSNIRTPSQLWANWGWYICVGAAWFLVGVVFWVWAWKGGGRADAAKLGQDEESRTHWRREVQRNRTTRIHSKLLIMFVVMVCVLTLAGFGYEIFNYVVYSRNTWLAHVGGGLTLLTTIVGAIYTAIKTSPVGGGDDNLAKGNQPSLPSRIVFAFTPPLVLIVLAIAASTLAHTLIFRIVGAEGVDRTAIASEVINSIPQGQRLLIEMASELPVEEYYTTEIDQKVESRISEAFRRRLRALTAATFVTIILCLTFAAAEVRWRKGMPKMGVAVVIALSLIAGFLTYRLAASGNMRPLWPLAIAVLAGCLVLARLAVDEAQSGDNSQHRSFKLLLFSSLWPKPFPAWRVLAASLMAFVLCVIVFLMLGWRSDLLLNPQKISPRAELVGTTTAALVFCLLFYLLGAWRGTGSNRRSLWLLSSVLAVLCVMLSICFFPPDYKNCPVALLAHIVVGLISVALGIVIALGWLADPNSLSMHMFYKDRLVRAYLGASNQVRGWWAKDITESVEGDDVLMSQLRNCQRGAPYHLVNTTLNLVAGRDLATAQRSSAMFVLSKRNCGSSRTGYRQTAKYMDGRLSLGTAIAISGAAASPNMGAHTFSASLSMLMAVLNVRLGYWAPTPYKQHWQLGQAQLWPFYTLRELVSQTNDLSSYCYLTDGGHFDNTGLYSLVERGCRYIVVADCAADPKPCFGDLGDVIRRCRIDFGAEISLDIGAFIKKADQKHASAHYVVGSITYDREHVKRLNWSPELLKDENEANLKGIIVLIKPALTADETVDVRQYSLENESFPQQTTADQWFDEAQFESYRRLGELCAGAVFDPKIVESLSKPDQDSKFRVNRPIYVGEVEKIFNAAGHASSGRKDVSQAASQLENRLWEMLEGMLQTDGRKRMPECDKMLKSLISGGVKVIDRMGYLPQHIEAAERNLCVLARLMREHAHREGHLILTPLDVSEALKMNRLFPFELAATT